MIEISSAARLFFPSYLTRHSLGSSSRTVLLQKTGGL
jgi:hypothetical protein